MRYVQTKTEDLQMVIMKQHLVAIYNDNDYYDELELSLIGRCVLLDLNGS